MHLRALIYNEEDGVHKSDGEQKKKDNKIKIIKYEKKTPVFPQLYMKTHDRRKKDEFKMYC